MTFYETFLRLFICVSNTGKSWAEANLEREDILAQLLLLVLVQENMSNQSGIVPSEELRGFLSTCRDGDVRCMKVSDQCQVVGVSYSYSCLSGVNRGGRGERERAPAMS